MLILQIALTVILIVLMVILFTLMVKVSRPLWYNVILVVILIYDANIAIKNVISIVTQIKEML